MVTFVIISMRKNSGMLNSLGKMFKSEVDALKLLNSVDVI